METDVLLADREEFGEFQLGEPNGIALDAEFDVGFSIRRTIEDYAAIAHKAASTGKARISMVMNEGWPGKDMTDRL